MDNVQTITRRAAVIGAAVSAAAFAAPVAAAVKPTTLEALAEKFRDDAVALDPRIGECWLGYDELAQGPRDMRVASIYFGRSDSPFIRPAPAFGAAPTITELFDEWHAARHDGADETENQANTRFARYQDLQRRITAMRPKSVREAAMQFMVETDDGESDYRDAFYRRLRRLAMDGTPS